MMTSHATAPTYSPAQLDAAYAAFRQARPTFDAPRQLDELRATEYGRLDQQGHIYLDYTGGGLYAASQLRAHMEMLSANVFGNPHSVNPTSQAATDLCERARAFVLEYFNASPDEYIVAFTSNASGALKLVGESYPFGPGGHYLLTYDNHNSVNGIREFARSRGAPTTYVPVTPPDLRLDEAELAALLAQPGTGAPRLFAYPAQSNFSGAQHSLEWIARAQASGWDVLLDAAAFAPTNRLDLSRWRPDFVPLSFYKMFGYPTGVGALIMRREAAKKLRRPWFSGGTIWAASVESDRLFMADDEAAFEDGTINYLNLPAIEIGLKHLQRVGIDAIHERVFHLTGWLLDNLRAMRHSNGAPLALIYGPVDMTMRGGTISLNFFDPVGKVVDERLVDRLTSARKISVRTGCFCNPGAHELAFSLAPESVAKNFQREDRPAFDDFLHSMGLQTGGAVRVSLGIATTFADVYRFMEFAQSLVDVVADEGELPARKHC